MKAIAPASGALVFLVGAPSLDLVAQVSLF